MYLNNALNLERVALHLFLVQGEVGKQRLDQLTFF